MSGFSVSSLFNLIPATVLMIWGACASAFDLDLNWIDIKGTTVGELLVGDRARVSINSFCAENENLMLPAYKLVQRENAGSSLIVERLVGDKFKVEFSTRSDDDKEAAALRLRARIEQLRLAWTYRPCGENLPSIGTDLSLYQITTVNGKKSLSELFREAR